MVNKALFIVEALYLGYFFLFLFDDATSYLVYRQNALYIIQIKKEVGSKQSGLHNGWFEQYWVCIIHYIFFQKACIILVQKRIKQVLKWKNSYFQK